MNVTKITLVLLGMGLFCGTDTNLNCMTTDRCKTGPWHYWECGDGCSCPDDLATVESSHEEKAATFYDNQIATGKHLLIFCDRSEISSRLIKELRDGQNQAFDVISGRSPNIICIFANEENVKIFNRYAPTIIPTAFLIQNGRVISKMPGMNRDLDLSRYGFES